MIHKTADVSKKAHIGKNVFVWANAVVREGAKIGDDVVVGGGVYIDHDVTVGSRVKIQNNALIYFGSEIEDEVFIGPGVICANDKYPRSTLSGKLKSSSDWQAGKIVIRKGASVGAGSILLPGVEIGPMAMIGAGSVVVDIIPSFALAFGNPAKVHGAVCGIGHIRRKAANIGGRNYFCKICKKTYQLDGK